MMKPKRNLLFETFSFLFVTQSSNKKGNKDGEKEIKRRQEQRDAGQI